MATTKKKEVTIELQPLNLKTMTVHIVGDGDLCLNKMDDPTARALMDKQSDKAKKLAKPNPWECIITSVHWRDGLPDTDRELWNEGTMQELLMKNAPCFTCFGFKKGIMDAIVRTGTETYSTKLAYSLNVIGSGSLIPIEFTQWRLIERLIPSKMGKVPLLAQLNTFSGWSARVTIQYTENVYSAEQIVNLINMAGFGGGIGSGRSSGYGRFHVEGVQ